MSMTHEITEGLPRNKKPRRKGRGESSGHGKTSGRGNKGSKARNGKYIKRGYEGGQTPIFRRFPKRGFSNENFERRFYIVNLADLERFDADTSVDAAVLMDAGLVPDEKLPIKILGEGPFTKKLTVAAAWYSKTAHQKIGEAGGVANNLSGAAFEFPKPKKIFVKRDKQAKAPEGEAASAPAPAAAAVAQPASVAPAEQEKPAAGE